MPETVAPLRICTGDTVSYTPGGYSVYKLIDPSVMAGEQVYLRIEGDQRKFAAVFSRELGQGDYEVVETSIRCFDQTLVAVDSGLGIFLVHPDTLSVAGRPVTAETSNKGLVGQMVRVEKKGGANAMVVVDDPGGPIIIDRAHFRIGQGADSRFRDGNYRVVAEWNLRGQGVIIELYMKGDYRWVPIDWIAGEQSRSRPSIEP
ncbi:MAG: hypothetical protein PHS44_06135 [Candidatus Dojkabacteria bacterium]|jgi:hypothetical protein|nr:hypothetical protein [Candidatus Dojkabacteria bacterium]